MPETLLSRLLRRIGRSAHPLFEPDAAERHAREKATRDALQHLTKAVERLAGSVEAVTARVDRIDRRQVEEMREAIALMQWANRRQMAFADRLLQKAHHQNKREFVRERVMRRLRAISKSRRPVIVGPWTGEVGFELLYWVPFVRWAIERFDIDHDRIVLMSRGGTHAWYGLPDVKYVDVLERRSTDALRERMAEAKKQRSVRLFDRRLIRELAGGESTQADLLHPSLMYAVFMPYWKQTASRKWAEEFTAVARIQPPTIPGLDLPRDYVAVRFYFSDCFPDTPDNRHLAESIVTSLARERDVVVLGSGVSVDEHSDLNVGAAASRVHSVTHLMTPENNLAVQTAVIAGASSFIGTYGGFSYLAPLCGVDTVALYSVDNYYEYHLDFAQQMFARVGGGSLTVVDTSVRDLVSQIAGVRAVQ